MTADHGLAGRPRATASGAGFVRTGCCVMLALVAVWGTPPAEASETVVAGLSQSTVSIAADFDGSVVLIFGAVRREQPIKTDPPLEVIVTVEGPAAPVVVRKKNRRAGIWLNTEVARFTSAPSFYAVATSGQLGAVLSFTDDLRYGITAPQMIRTVGAAGEVGDVDSFTEALIRIREEAGLYQLREGTVDLEQSTLFRTSIALPASITEGNYKARIFLTRDGTVIDRYDATIRVGKVGLERWLYRLAQDHPAAYGVLALVMAVAAGWGASAAFRFMRV